MSDIMINFSGRNKIFSDSVRYQFKFLRKMNMEAIELIKTTNHLKLQRRDTFQKIKERYPNIDPVF